MGNEASANGGESVRLPPIRELISDVIPTSEVLGTLPYRNYLDEDARLGKQQLHCKNENNQIAPIMNPAVAKIMSKKCNNHNEQDEQDNEEQDSEKPENNDLSMFEDSSERSKSDPESPNGNGTFSFSAYGNGSGSSSDSSSRSRSGSRGGASSNLSIFESTSVESGTSDRLLNKSYISGKFTGKFLSKEFEDDLPHAFLSHGENNDAVANFEGSSSRKSKIPRIDGGVAPKQTADLMDSHGRSLLNGSPEKSSSEANGVESTETSSNNNDLNNSNNSSKWAGISPCSQGNCNVDSINNKRMDINEAKSKAGDKVNDKASGKINGEAISNNPQNLVPIEPPPKPRDDVKFSQIPVYSFMRTSELKNGDQAQNGPKMLDGRSQASVLQSSQSPTTSSNQESKTKVSSNDLRSPLNEFHKKDLNRSTNSIPNSLPNGIPHGLHNGSPSTPRNIPSNLFIHHNSRSTDAAPPGQFYYPYSQYSSLASFMQYPAPYQTGSRAAVAAGAPQPQQQHMYMQPPITHSPINGFPHQMVAPPQTSYSTYNPAYASQPPQPPAPYPPQQQQNGNNNIAKSAYGSFSTNGLANNQANGQSNDSSTGTCHVPLSTTLNGGNQTSRQNNHPEFHIIDSATGRHLVAEAPRRRGNLPKDVTNILRTWLTSHLGNPYPTEEDKMKLVDKTGLSLIQVSNWFINARRRSIPASHRRNKLSNQYRGESTEHETRSESNSESKQPEAQ